MSGRKLTTGEITLAETLFGKSIDYTKITMYDRKINALQPDNLNAAPDGNLYMIKDYCPDYSQASVEAKASFLHEMTHVWQRQNNTRNLNVEAVREVSKTCIKAVRLREKFHYAMTSRYVLENGKDLNDYAYEQQAGIIEDFTRVSGGKTPLYNEAAKVPTANEYKATLAKLTVNPAYARRPKKGFC